MGDNITSNPALAERLRALGQTEFADVENFLADWSHWECGALLIEACRCLDYVHIMQILAQPPGDHLTAPDFDIIRRGWNVLLGLLLPRVGQLNGIPATPSNEDSQRMAISVMHALGRHVILTDTAERLGCGLIVGEEDADEIRLACADVTLIDFYHDQVDHGRLADLRESFLPREEPGAKEAVRALRADMSARTFRWELPSGVMVGYETTPEIDRQFSEIFWTSALDWRNHAGIHPEARLPGCTGGDLMATVTVMMSFYLKHIIFVEEARKRFPDVNHHMSLTIWKTRQELVESLIAVGSPEDIANAVIDLVTVGSEDAAFFLNERTPSIPLLIQIADGYLLTPASAVFQNPFNQIRTLRETTSPEMQNAVRLHRESWMAEDLCALFEGTRYQRVSRQTKLRSGGRIVTDIDAAIFDQVTGELVLLQLKWQDFTSSNIRTQKSKASNFAKGVEDWGRKVTTWLDDHGVATLCRALQIKMPAGRTPTVVRLWGIGRSNARFKSLGYAADSTVLVLTWPQLIRLRHQICPGADIFAEIATRAEAEALQPIERIPFSYVMPLRDARIVFKDIWSNFGEIPTTSSAEADDANPPTASQYYPNP